MADDTTLNPGVGGDDIATDDIGGVKYQRVKLTMGADGVNDLDVADSNPMPVKLTTVAGQVLATGSGVAVPALRVELPTDGQGRVFARSNPVDVSVGGRTTVPFTEVSTQIVPPSSLRKSVLLYNEGSSAVRIGIGEAADLDKIPLLPGNYLEFEGSGAVNGWLAIAAGVAVDVTWVQESYA